MKKKIREEIELDTYSISDKPLFVVIEELTLLSNKHGSDALLVINADGNDAYLRINLLYDRPETDAEYEIRQKRIKAGKLGSAARRIANKERELALLQKLKKKYE